MPPLGRPGRSHEMTIHTIKMPDIGEGIVEVELVAWRVKPGDRVTEDQILADVMTDKATVEIPSPVHGKVLALGGEAGVLMAVGAELISIELDGEGQAEAAPAAPRAAPSVVAQAHAAPPAQTAPPAERVDTGPVAASGAERAIASPSVRRRAWELGVDLQQVPASGLGGRVMQLDLEAYAARQGGASPKPAPKPTLSRPVPSDAPCSTMKRSSRSPACAGESPRRCRSPSAAFRISPMWRKSIGNRRGRCRK